MCLDFKLFHKCICSSPIFFPLQYVLDIKVYNSFPESPDFCMLGGDEEETYPVLVLTGDAFSSSGFDNCVHAAENSVRALLKTLPIEDIDNTSQNIFQT